MTIGNQRGAGLVLAILIIVALFVLGTSLAFLTRTDVNISKHQTMYTGAVYVAEAGIEEAVHRLGLRDPTNVTVNGSTFNAAIRDPSSPADPVWKARIFLCRPGSAPSAGTGQYHTVTVQNQADWLTYSHASDTLEALTIEHKWRDRNDDGIRDANEVVLYDGGRYPPENFVKGTPVEVITTTGRDATAERQIRVEVVKLPLNVNARAALMSDKTVDVRGTVCVCGHDHVLATPENTQDPDCQDWEVGGPGHDCNESGCLIGVMTTGDEIDRRGSTDLFGHPAEDTSSTNPFYTLPQALGLSQAEVDDILAEADYTDVGQADPQDGITYVDNPGGDARWNGGTGSGLLYVTGDLTIAGNWSWKGLVYVEGDFKINGNPWILGAVIVKGTSEVSPAFSGGNPTILYSSEALNHYLSQHLKYVKIGWKEIGGL
ncbi:MAG: pilus assembly PilX N-terminal domain-containing protein [bacterium]